MHSAQTQCFPSYAGSRLVKSPANGISEYVKPIVHDDYFEVLYLFMLR